jgi:hypothetical protein
MNRSVLSYPLNRGVENDVGGVADLQTDVMRFMAIISMCLVAIFALVQSIPVESPPVDEPAATTPAAQPAEEPAEKPPADIVLTHPAVRKPPSAPAPVELRHPAPERAVEVATPVESARPEQPSPAPVTAVESPTEARGFTLRFESDDALSRLVARDVISLYAITASRTSRLSIDAGRPTFWASSTPQRVHEMDPTTVPASLVAAWQRANRDAATTVKWGVALPPAMSEQLNSFLASADGGSLIIDDQGRLRLEQ